jgi:Fic family protein
MGYIYERKDWPKLTWSHERLAGRLAAVRHRQGRLIGRMVGLGFSLRNEAVLQSLTEDVLKSSEIEGEKLAFPAFQS